MSKSSFGLARVRIRVVRISEGPLYIHSKYCSAVMVYIHAKYCSAVIVYIHVKY